MNFNFTFMYIYLYVHNIQELEIDKISVQSVPLSWIVQRVGWFYRYEKLGRDKVGWFETTNISIHRLLFFESFFSTSRDH